MGEDTSAGSAKRAETMKRIDMSLPPRSFRTPSYGSADRGVVANWFRDS